MTALRKRCPNVLPLVGQCSLDEGHPDACEVTCKASDLELAMRYPQFERDAGPAWTPECAHALTPSASMSARCRELRGHDGPHRYVVATLPDGTTRDGATIPPIGDALEEVHTVTLELVDPTEDEIAASGIVECILAMIENPSHAGQLGPELKAMLLPLVRAARVNR